MPFLSKRLGCYPISHGNRRAAQGWPVMDRLEGAKGSSTGVVVHQAVPESNLAEFSTKAILTN